MRENRMLQNDALRGIAIQLGLYAGSEVIIRERSMLKDGSYITRQIRRGVVLKLYPYHFYCQIADGTKESFRYNEFLGYEARLIRLKEGKKNEARDVERRPFAMQWKERRICSYNSFRYDNGKNNRKNTKSLLK